MEPNVPPDLFRVIDAAGGDEEFQIILILGEALKRVRNAGAREAFEDLQPVGTKPGVFTKPERRVGRKRQERRQPKHRAAESRSNGGHVAMSKQQQNLPVVFLKYT